MDDNEFFTSRADRERLKAALDRLESMTVDEYTVELKAEAKRLREAKKAASKEEAETSEADSKSSESATDKKNTEKESESDSSSSKKKRKLDSNSPSSTLSDSATKKLKTDTEKGNVDVKDGSAKKKATFRPVINPSQRNAIEEFATKRLFLIQGAYGCIFLFISYVNKNIRTV